MQFAPQGSYAIGWDQVTLDGVAGVGMADCRAGRAWRWTGRALRLDGPPDVLRLGDCAEAADLRRRARRGAGRFVAVPAEMDVEAGALGGPAITVTDGRRSWRVELLPAQAGRRGVAHFPQVPPPAGVELWIARVDGAEALDAEGQADVWPGVAAGTLVDTPDGPVAVERIVVGNRVRTEGGVARVVWTAAREVTGARLCVAPELTPVRIAAGALGRGCPAGELLVAPDQGIVLDGPRVRALYPQGPVVVAARDLVDGRGITRAEGMPGMVAHVVVTDGGCVLASGVVLDGGLPDLLSASGQVAVSPLRRLSRGEAAILRAVC